MENLAFNTVKDIVKYRYENEKVIEKVGKVFLPIKYGNIGS